MQLLSNHDELLEKLAEHKELIEEFVLSRKDFGAVNPEDLSTRTHLRDIFDAFWRAHCATQVGDLPSERWDALCAAIRMLLTTSLYRAYWKKHREEFPLDYQAFIDALIVETRAA